MNKNDYFLPIKLNLYLTTMCDYKCDYCFFAENNLLNKQTISIEGIKIILQNIIKYKVPLISINGGDPFILEKLPQLIKIITNHKSYCIVGGNANHLSEEYCKALKNSGLKFLQLGIDSLSTDKINNYKEFNYINKVKKAIENLKKQNIKFSIAMCINNKNYNEIYKIEKFSKDIGAEHLKISFYEGNNTKYKISSEVKKNILKKINNKETNFIKYFESCSTYVPKYPTLTIYSNGNLAIEETGYVIGNIYKNKDFGKLYVEFLKEERLLS